MALTRITSREIKDATIVHGDVAAANIDGLVAVPSMRTIGTGAQQACAGNDARLSDDRTGSGLRTATTVVDVHTAAAPTAGQVLQATADNAAEWATLDIVGAADIVENEIPAGTKDGANAEFTLANTPVAGSVKLYLNGIRLTPTVDFTVAVATITLNAGHVPVADDNLLCDYRK